MYGTIVPAIIRFVNGNPGANVICAIGYSYMIAKIPAEVRTVLSALHDAGFEAFAVGGCVRDLLVGHTPKDWDITTNARPDTVQEIFPDSFYENHFGTVGVKVAPFLSDGAPDRAHDVIEVTTFRTETTYSDRRHPDAITFADTLAEDLSRRDFTMNAIAIASDGTITDPFGGQKDLDARRIRAVGDAHTRFNEDALRMMRAIRFAAQLDFTIDAETLQSIAKNSHLLTHVSRERIRDEFSKIIMSAHPRHGIQTLHDTGLLGHFMPELEDGIGVGQNHHHTLTVWEHNLAALQECPSTKLDVRLAALLHDVGKPAAKRGTGRDVTFYNHEYISARMTKNILRRLHYPTHIVERTTMLVRNHMFYYSVGDVTEAAVRRLIAKVGLENMKDLMDVRIGDRMGSGTKKAKPYKLRHLEYMVDKVSHDPVSVKMLALDGTMMINDLGFAPGPQIGAVLDVLLAEVLDDPARNTYATLAARATELKDEDIVALRALAKDRITEQRDEDDTAFKKKHFVA